MYVISRRHLAMAAERSSSSKRCSPTPASLQRPLINRAHKRLRIRKQSQTFLLFPSYDAIGFEDSSETVFSHTSYTRFYSSACSIRGQTACKPVG
jgi:hypothetical protein